MLEGGAVVVREASTGVGVVHDITVAVTDGIEDIATLAGPTVADSSLFKTSTFSTVAVSTTLALTVSTPVVSTFTSSSTIACLVSGSDTSFFSPLFSQPGKSSSLSPGRKVSILPQVTPHSVVGCPLDVKNKFLPLVSITSNMFFRLSGRASARISVLAVAQNCPTKSRIVSHRAVKVGRLDKGPRCCRNTLDSIIAALSFVSSLPWSGLADPPISNNFLSIGKRTLRKANSH